MNDATGSPQTSGPGDMPRVVYRFFEEEEHADALVRGEVWLSTLIFVRKHHHAADPGEGIAGWTPDFPRDDKIRQDHVIDQMNATGHITMIGCSNVNFESNRIFNIEEDGYLICTTLNRAIRGFGNYGVCINDPADFFKAVDAQLRRKILLTEMCGFGPMRYVPREIQGINAHSHHSAFIGHEHNVQEQEARMLWVPQDIRDLTPMLLHVPEAARFCTRL